MQTLALHPLLYKTIYPPSNQRPPHFRTNSFLRYRSLALSLYLWFACFQASKLRGENEATLNKLNLRSWMQMLLLSLAWTRICFILIWWTRKRFEWNFTPSYAYCFIYVYNKHRYSHNCTYARELQVRLCAEYISSMLQWIHLQEKNFEKGAFEWNSRIIANNIWWRSRKAYFDSIIISCCCCCYFCCHFPFWFARDESMNWKNKCRQLVYVEKFRIFPSTHKMAGVNGQTESMAILMQRSLSHSWMGEYCWLTNWNCVGQNRFRTVPPITIVSTIIIERFPIKISRQYAAPDIHTRART